MAQDDHWLKSRIKPHTAPHLLSAWEACTASVRPHTLTPCFQPHTPRLWGSKPPVRAHAPQGRLPAPSPPTARPGTKDVHGTGENLRGSPCGVEWPGVWNSSVLPRCEAGLHCGVQEATVRSWNRHATQGQTSTMHLFLQVRKKQFECYPNIPIRKGTLAMYTQLLI